MLAIYDDNGNLINETSSKAAIVGSLYSLEVTVPDNKVLDHIDTSSADHIAVFRDKPKTELEQLQDTVSSSLMMFVMKDMDHDTEISKLKLEINKINALLMKGNDTNE
ncbi:hypothetical protein KQI77_02500 [Clostridium sp. MSJ-8]|uniref:hypothetical protein n=1 Tax=Clostridium sp. MSJ-8 TaxID=2841510 RepID=UPI001C0E9F8D|nr:hypothetical protein [Clostridium sp. MSJ-8]MBU5487032.1 hypothetical protein [Clostridium sp. MSJ-8]